MGMVPTVLWRLYSDFWVIVFHLRFYQGKPLYNSRAAKEDIQTGIFLLYFELFVE